MTSVWCLPSILHPAFSFQNQDNDTLKDLLSVNVERPVTLRLYSCRTLTVREAVITPSALWGGRGLIGVSIRFCNFQGVNENVWHVLVSARPAQETQTGSNVDN